MFKMGLKGIIFLMGIQSLIGKLQTEGIVSGSIHINYRVLHEKLVNIVTSAGAQTLVDKLDSQYNSDGDAWQRFNESEHNEWRPVNRNIRVYSHIVQYGETLSQLGAQYGVAWQVIKKANHIQNEHHLQIGQRLIIPILEISAV